MLEPKDRVRINSSGKTGYIVARRYLVQTDDVHFYLAEDEMTPLLKSTEEVWAELGVAIYRSVRARSLPLSRAVKFLLRGDADIFLTTNGVEVTAEVVNQIDEVINNICVELMTRRDTHDKSI